MGRQGSDFANYDEYIASDEWKAKREECLEAWGYEVNFYNVPDLEGFLQAALLLPCSLTADFNLPGWGAVDLTAVHRPVSVNPSASRGAAAVPPRRREGILERTGRHGR